MSTEVLAYPEEAIEVVDDIDVDPNEEVDMMEETNEASHMEADEDEVDPELVVCPLCETVTHLSVGKCSAQGCTHVFEILETGHLADGFVCGEDDIEYEDGVSEDEESVSDGDFTSSEEEDGMDDDENPWCADSDEEWCP